MLVFRHGIAVVMKLGPWWARRSRALANTVSVRAGLKLTMHCRVSGRLSEVPRVSQKILLKDCPRTPASG